MQLAENAISVNAISVKAIDKNKVCIIYKYLN